MDIIAINQAIEDLENDDTTPENVSELAALYICRDNLENRKELTVDIVESELEDILPYYLKYRTTKRKYQLNQATDGEVLQGIKDVCRELKEFIDTLYSSTDMHRERLTIKRTIRDIYEKYKD